MIIHILFTLIIMLTALQIHAMELAIFSRHNNHYKHQILPNEIWDKIIASSSHNARKNIKETCTQLAYLTSINRLDKFIMHDFVIGDETEKKAFLSALIKTSNPQLITPIITYAQREAQFTYLNDTPESIYITLESERNSDEESSIELEEENTSIEKNIYDKYIQTYVHKHYLKPLLKEAIKQDNEIMVDRINQEDITTKLITYYKRHKSNQRWALGEKIFIRTVQIICGTMLTATAGLAVTVSILKSPLCFYNGTQHCNVTLP